MVNINIDNALKHLTISDQRFSKLIKKFGNPDFKPQKNYLKSLIRSIIYQQLSGKSAFAIYSRFIKLFPVDHFPDVNEILLIPNQTYRDIGLSKQKTVYIKEIAKSFEQKTVQSNILNKMTNSNSVDNTQIMF